VAIASELFTAPGQAQSRTGFAVNRFEPAEHGSRYFVVDPLDLRAGSAAAGATFDYGYKPLVIYDVTGAERHALVRHQLFAHLGGSVVVASRLRLAVDAPVALYQDGEAAVVSGERLSASTAPAFGDVRLAADVRVLGEHDQPLSIAVGARLWLPTGLRSQFTGDGSARVSPQVLGAGAFGAFVWAARLAIEYRSRDDAYAGRSLGSEVFAAAGLGLRTRDRRLLVGPEIQAASAFTSGAHFLGKRETPAEWTFGAHYDLFPNLRVGAGVGCGIGHGYGAPLVRGLASIEWIAAAAAPRREHENAPLEEHTPWEGGGEQPPAPEKPLAVMTENEIRIEEQLRFATDSAELAGESDAVLAAVKRVLDEHSDVRIRIEGHTDATGDEAYNDDLSTRRAAAVQAWLLAKGIDASRLESAGYGSKQPIDSNETEAGRAKNRRVVFRIVGR
jgi:outer membrane protein OmpA-like peptidoglycan-associated protein